MITIKRDKYWNQLINKIVIVYGNIVPRYDDGIFYIGLRDFLSDADSLKKIISTIDITTSNRVRE